MKEFPKLSVWVTSTGRVQNLPLTIESFIKYCTYPNYEILIVESQMTDISKKFFALEYVYEKETVEYLNQLPVKFPDISFQIFVQPFKILGQVYDQLLSLTGDYYINVEDDNETFCDPAPILPDLMNLLDNDPQLLGMRVDLRDETVYENCPRFPEFKEYGDHKYVLWKDWCSGGNHVMDARKVRQIGGFITDHAPDQYIQTEHDQTRKMCTAEMYIGISLKWWGFVGPHGSFGVQGGDRRGPLDMYREMAEYGWLGDGKNRRPKPHDSAYWYTTRRNNGRP